MPGGAGPGKPAPPMFKRGLEAAAAGGVVYSSSMPPAAGHSTKISELRATMDDHVSRDGDKASIWNTAMSLE